MPQPQVPGNPTDRALALDALGGDEWAFVRLIERHGHAIRQAIRPILRGQDACDVDDVHQTVLLKLCEHGARVLGLWSGLVAPAAPDESLAPYLAKVARNCAFDLLRGLHTGVGTGPCGDEPADPWARFAEGVHVDPEFAMELELRRRLARACLDALPSGTRAALRQRILGRADIDAARVLAITHGAYRQRVSAGIRLLAACIAQGGPGPGSADNVGA